MHFSQHYIDCLSHASYLIGDETTGRAVVVDPQRDVSSYLEEAKDGGFSIGLVIETHFHADFVSGHLELAAVTGAEIGYGEGAHTDFPSRSLGDGERIVLGDVVLEIRATPGHTPESISVVVWEHADDAAPYGVLTGDTLFIGDVGRPDLLAAGDNGITSEAMAHSLYTSLRQKLLTLPDATRVFPAHGAGSACGKQLSTETQSTIGEQRRTNYALAPMDVERFVALVTEGQSAPPPYFGFDARKNREAHALLDEQEPPAVLDLDTIVALQAAGAVVLDTRDPADFAAGHLRDAINVGLAGRFAEYVGDVVDADRDIVLVCDPGTELEARVRLARIGYDRVTGALRTPTPAFLASPHLVGRGSRVTAEELAVLRGRMDELVVIDVRAPAEVAAGAIAGALSLPLPRLAGETGHLEPARPTVVYCAGGYRSSIAASYLRWRDFADVSDLLGGYGAWAATSS